MSESKSFEELFFSYNAETQFQTKSVKILLISNINSNTMYVERIKEWQLEKNIYFDLVLMVGNFMAESPMSTKNDKEYICRCEAKIATMVSFLENLALPLIYMGGKNDPYFLFEENPPTFTIKSKNCYDNYYRICDDLYIIGQGNCYNEYENNKRNILNILENYLEISESFLNIKKKIEKENSTPNIKYIYLSFDVPKTWQLEENVYKNENVVDEKIYNPLAEEKNILINIHQNFKESKLFKYKDISVINPGQLENGNFAILDLDRDSENGNVWKIKEIKFYRL